MEVADYMEEQAALTAIHGGDDLALLVPLSGWTDIPASEVHQALTARSIELPGGRRAIEVLVAADERSDLSSVGCASLLHAALRADSIGAPASHRQAAARGKVWVDAEINELGNHRRNQTWTLIEPSEVPPGRKIHRFLWVYKQKRDGTCKARLCVDGSSLEAGIDFDQTFSAALKYTSARAIFAYAARYGCDVRSIDLVAAYLQGEFLDGEVVYCRQPEGYVVKNASGVPLVARVDKPVYGIQQAGRRLQRKLTDFMRSRQTVGNKTAFSQLDDSDSTVYVYESDDGERVVVGIYVDNLQIAHSVQLDSAGRGPKGSFYEKFRAELAEEFDVVDEGPMVDLLGIEVERNENGSITLHQRSYIGKLVSRFLPDGLPSRVQRNSLPYSQHFDRNLAAALAQDSNAPLHPELVKPFQSVVGSLMYASSCTRPDIAFVTSKLCQCLTKPTPELYDEALRVVAYLGRHADVGLTYTREYADLKGYADASWETRYSTSGWVVLWQSAAVHWGSRRQHSVALSSCEAEIIALSEAAKDMIYLRKFLYGLDPSHIQEPSPLNTDSQSARDVSYNPEHHGRMKHVHRRHFFVRDLVERFEIVVPFVRTHENIADFFTKTFSAAPFFQMRAVIMNEAARGDRSAAAADSSAG